jgi:pyridoxamine 5'-phosphate oxidase
MNMNETLENLRVSYRHSSLDTKDCDPNPRLQFDKWFEDAVKSKCDEPNAFVLSTVKNNRPRGRVVLLKGIHQEQFVFYTNYQSAKGQEIETCTYVSMTFLWLPLQRQVRIEGRIQKVDPILSDDYFQKRPLGNQIGAVASPQSKKVESRAELEQLFHEAEEKSKIDTYLARPENWGGYSILPDYFEFWQGRDSRMHDRIIYEKSEAGWNLGRLAP